MTRTSTEIILGDVTFSAEDIKSALIIEEFDPMSLTLPISTLSATIYNRVGDFSILNPVRSYVGFNEMQPVSVYETIDNDRFFIGLYFLEEWKNTEMNLVELSLIDQVGKLDKITYYGGMWLEGIRLLDLCKNICAVAGISVVLDPDVEDIELKGWLPILSCREALQQAAFAAGVTVLSARQPGFIRIGQLGSYTTSISYGIRSGVSVSGQSRNWMRRWRPPQWEFGRPLIEISRSEFLENYKVEQNQYVNGIELVSHNYSESTEAIELFKGELASGEHEVQFSEPAHTLSVTGASILSSNVNSANLEVSSAGEVILSGYKYADNQKLFSKYDGRKRDTVRRIDQATLVNNDNSQAVLERLYEYYQKRLTQKSSILSMEVRPGDEVQIDTFFLQKIRGTIEKSKIDLAGGFIAEVEIVGEVIIPIGYIRSGVSAVGQTRVFQRKWRPQVILD